MRTNSQVTFTKETLNGKLHFSCSETNYRFLVCLMQWTGFTNKSKSLLVFYKKAVVKNFAYFFGKHLCRHLFLKKLHTYSLQLSSNRYSNTGVFLWSLQNLSEQPFCRTPPGDCCWTQIGSWHWNLATESFINDLSFRYLVPSW